MNVVVVVIYGALALAAASFIATNIVTARERYEDARLPSNRSHGRAA